jgi:hypothetical protein
VSRKVPLMAARLLSAAIPLVRNRKATRMSEYCVVGFDVKA